MSAALTAIRSVRILFIVHVLLGAAIGAGEASAQSTSSPEEEKAITDTALTLTEVFNEAWQEMDPERILTFYSDDLQYYRMGTHTSSRAAFEHALDTFILPRTESYRVEVVDPRVRVMGPDAAVVGFVSRGEVVRRTGETESVEGAFTLVYERRHGEWKIVHVHESSAAPDEE